jgi:hypothetical protein
LIRFGRFNANTKYCEISAIASAIQPMDLMLLAEGSVPCGGETLFAGAE